MTFIRTTRHSLVLYLHAFYLHKMQLYLFVMCNLATLDINKIGYLKFQNVTEESLTFAAMQRQEWLRMCVSAVMCCVVLFFVFTTLQDTFSHYSLLSAFASFKDDVSSGANAKYQSQFDKELCILI